LASAAICKNGGVTASRRVSNDSSAGITTITNKLDSLGRDMKKLKENVNAIQVRCENCGVDHLNKECPLHEEVKYAEFGRPFPNNNRNGARYCIVNTEKSRKEEWAKKLLESTKLNTRNQNASLKNLETQIDQLAKYYKAKAANEVPDPSVGQCKAIFANNKVPTDEASSKETTKLQGVSFISDDNVVVPEEIEERIQGVLTCQLPPNELNPGSFTLPCIIGSLNFYAMADLGASVNIMPRLMLTI
ncbi:hypothetical protein Tco_1287079, partial [Tanacetum coccineum]